MREICTSGGDVGHNSARLDAQRLGFADDGIGLGLVGADVDDDMGAFAAQFRTVARPMLRPEPVTRATFPASSPIGHLLVGDGPGAPRRVRTTDPQPSPRSWPVSLLCQLRLAFSAANRREKRYLAQLQPADC
jgi:hypothetical protein